MPTRLVIIGEGGNRIPSKYSNTQTKISENSPKTRMILICLKVMRKRCRRLSMWAWNNKKRESRKTSLNSRLAKREIIQKLTRHQWLRKILVTQIPNFWQKKLKQKKKQKALNRLKKMIPMISNDRLAKSYCFSQIKSSKANLLSIYKINNSLSLAQIKYLSSFPQIKLGLKLATSQTSKLNQKSQVIVLIQFWWVRIG